MDKEMKIGAFTIITDPIHRQDPWKEGIAQMLEVFDEVVVVHGSADDPYLISAYFQDHPQKQKLTLRYLNWPQPEWSYEELPKHLNLGLNTLIDIGCDWGVRLDIDTAVHEKDSEELRKVIGDAERRGIWLVRLEKYQFFQANKCYEKGKIPLVVNLKKPISYGFDFDRYNDLCQPIKWDGKTEAMVNGKSTGIPAGRKVNDSSIMDSKIHVWNYDYTFKTKERAAELLYQFERAHERFWQQGYTGRKGDDITPESAMYDFIQLSSGRLKKMVIQKNITDHPHHFQYSLNRLTSPQFGFDLWAKTVQ